MRVRYCGGCRSQYDRVGAVDSLRRRLGGRVRWVDGDDEEVEWVVLVSGCPTACAESGEGGPPEARPIRTPEEAQAWAAEVESHLQGDFTPCKES